ncbi:MAG: YncE family protein, partial [Bacteroidota bacterium]|nr:YncE family protein [Bacteroidota bacterium]
MKKNKLSCLAVVLVFFFFSCKKNNPAPPVVIPKVSTGLFILNQGLYGANNTTLTYYDFGTQKATTDYFKNVNGFGLGDTGSDLISYGGKMYIVINNSGYVAVANSVTAKFIDSIDFKNAGVNRGPENVVGAEGKVFVSSTDGTVAVIDTTTLKIIRYIQVGSNPAQMVVAGDNLYVSNTGGFSASYDSTVSVIPLSSLAESGKITVGKNPGSITTDNTGNIYVVCTGDYHANKPSLVKFDINTYTVVKTADSVFGTIRYYNNSLLTTGGYLGAANVGYLNTNDFSAIRPSFITDGTMLQNPYGLDIDDRTGDVYVGDAKDYVSSGELFCFDNTGKKKFSFPL